MVPNRSRPAIAVAMALAGALVVAACTPLSNPKPLAHRCTTSIGNLPDFTLVNSGQPFLATRPATGGVTVVAVSVEVEPGSFDYVLWDVLGAEDYDQPPDFLMYFVQDNPTFLNGPTVVEITVYEDTPVGDYELRVRGLAFEGTFFDDIEDAAVGECFHDFEVQVR